MDAEVEQAWLRVDEANRRAQIPGIGPERRLRVTDVRNGSGCRRDPVWLHYAVQVYLWHVWFTGRTDAGLPTIPPCKHCGLTPPTA